MENTIGDLKLAGEVGVESSMKDCDKYVKYVIDGKINFDIKQYFATVREVAKEADNMLTMDIISTLNKCDKDSASTLNGTLASAVFDAEAGEDKSDSQFEDLSDAISDGANELQKDARWVNTAIFDLKYQLEKDYKQHPEKYTEEEYHKAIECLNKIDGLFR